VYTAYTRRSVQRNMGLTRSQGGSPDGCRNPQTSQKINLTLVLCHWSVFSVRLLKSNTIFIFYTVLKAKLLLLRCEIKLSRVRKMQETPVQEPPLTSIFGSRSQGPGYGPVGYCFSIGTFCQIDFWQKVTCI